MHCRQKKATDQAEAPKAVPRSTKDLEAELSELKEMMRQILANQTAGTTTLHHPAETTVTAALTGGVAIQGDNNTINQIHNNIQINVFGQERVDHIGARQIYELLLNARNATEPAVQALLETALVIFSDPEHPENLTCYLPNKKTQDALIHGKTGWQIQPVELVLDPMMKRSFDVIFQKQPFGGEEGLPENPDIKGCGEVLKQLMRLEEDAHQSKRASGPNGPLRSVLVRNKDELSRALGGAPGGAGTSGRK
jgi:hypothetical protein